MTAVCYIAFPHERPTDSRPECDDFSTECARNLAFQAGITSSHSTQVDTAACLIGIIAHPRFQVQARGLQIRIVRSSMSTQSSALTQREREIMQLIVQGLSNRQIGLALGIAEHTVEKHLSNVYRKLNVTNRMSAVFAHLEASRLAPDVHTGFPS